MPKFRVGIEIAGFFTFEAENYEEAREHISGYSDGELLMAMGDNYSYVVVNSFSEE